MALLALIAGAVVVSSYTLGQTGSNKGAGSPITSQRTPTANPASATGESPQAADRFSPDGGVLTYQPVKGDMLFAMQIKPNLPRAKRLPRDYVIMISTAASMAGPSWIGALQIADGIVQTADERDRLNIWLIGDKVGDRKQTRSLTNGFINPQSDKMAIATRMKLLQKEYPSGVDDLKDALNRAIADYTVKAGRQCVLLYLGNGQSMLEPLSADDRNAIANKMVAKQIACFTVPLGRGLVPEVLHGLPSSTGGLVLRTLIEQEKLTDAMKRYDEAFTGAILYSPKVQLPAEVISTDVFPTQLPPLRADAPTLVVGKMKPAAAFRYTITGTLAGRDQEISLNVDEKLQAADLENYFLTAMVQQWRKAKDRPAVLQANRALSLAYENARLKHDDLLLSAQLAIEKNQYEAAERLYQDVRQLAPHDTEAEAGIKVIDKLRSGILTPEKLRRSLAKSGKGDRLETDKATGKPRWTKADLVQFVNQLDEKKPAPDGQQKGGVANPNPGLEQDLLQAHRDRMVVEEQKMTQATEAAIGMARKDLAADPDGVLEVLRGLYARVKDDPDLGERTRENLLARLNTTLRDSAGQARELKLRKETQAQQVATIKSELDRQAQKQTFVERLEAQFRAFRSLMNEARFETAAMQEMLKGMVDIEREAKIKGFPVPQTAQAFYRITQASYQINHLDDLRRQRQEGFLSVMLSVEKSHIPFADEPGIYFPPLSTWKAIEKLRKDKYEVSSLPDDPKGRDEAKKVQRLLDEVIDTKDFQEPMPLRQALQLFYEKFAAKGQDLPIVVDINAFKEADDSQPNGPYDDEVRLPAVPKTMTMGTALRLILSQVKSNNATYLIRRNFIEVTTNDRLLADKVLRVYPVGDLVLPIKSMQMFGGTGAGGFAGGFGGVGGGMMGMMGMQGGMGGMMGMMGMGGGMGGMMGMMGMAGMGGMGGMGGMMGLGGMGGMMGLGGGRMGMGGGMMGMNMGMMGMGGGMGGMMGMMGMGGGMGGMMMGMMGMGGGMGGMMMGMMGMGGGMNMMGGMGQFQGGAFQGGFNGSLGIMGATNAYSLILTITRVVAPGTWFYALQPQPFMMGGFGMGGFGMGGFGPFMGGFGGGFMGFGGFMGGFMGGFPGGFGGFGGMMGMMGMMGAGPPPPPPGQGGPSEDITTANTIDFFPPTLALIVRAPSRIHYSPFGGVIGGKSKPKEAAALWAEQVGKDAIVRGPDRDKDGKIKPAGAGGGAMIAANQKREDLDPTKIWDEALDKGGVDAGLVLATADFLFQYGHVRHAAEFLKANLRRGIVVRPWVYEALAIAMEASGGDPEEIRRARLSAVALDPTDVQGFLRAAQTLAENKEYDKALSFCRQAAQLEPNLVTSYRDALAYADLGKDSRSMEWAVGKLVAQDWPTDNALLHEQAALRVGALATTLKQEHRGDEAAKLKDVLQRLRQRDLIVKLTWDNASANNLAEVELTIKEPTGTICSAKQPQTPGGGTLVAANFFEKKRTEADRLAFNVTYAAAEAFSGEYEINVRRLWGQPYGNRARLEVVQNAGTPKEVRRIEFIELTQGKTVKVNLKSGRRTELAVVSPANQAKPQETVKDERPNDAWVKLRRLAFPDFVGAKTVAGGAASRSASQAPVLVGRPRSGKSLPINEAPLVQGAIRGSGVNLTAEVGPSADGREFEMRMRPIFQALGGSRSSMNFDVIPGAGQ
jgi:tetratricopeptide (TPR) repeat protein